jgi:hypothetical protein
VAVFCWGKNKYRSVPRGAKVVSLFDGLAVRWSRRFGYGLTRHALAWKRNTPRSQFSAAIHRDFNYFNFYCVIHRLKIIKSLETRTD